MVDDLDDRRRPGHDQRAKKRDAVLAIDDGVHAAGGAGEAGQPG
jgi:hypothetical protein